MSITPGLYITDRHLRPSAVDPTVGHYAPAEAAVQDPGVTSHVTSQLAPPLSNVIEFVEERWRALQDSNTLAPSSARGGVSWRLQVQATSRM